MKVKLLITFLIAVLLFGGVSLPTINGATTPIIYLDKWGGEVGTVVNIRCLGFTPNKLVEIKYTYTVNTQIIASKITDGKGECTIAITIPPSPSGKNYITAFDELKLTAITEFTVIPAVTLEPKTATAGDDISVRGTGFRYNDEITIYIDKVALSRVTVAVSGSFIAVFTVPALKSGVNLVEIRDIRGESSWLELPVFSKLLINKVSGEVGTVLTLNGSGFNAEADVQIKFDSAEVIVIATDNTGKFTTSFPVPVTEAGAHVISAGDGTNLQQVNFTVEYIPPPTPELINPKNKIRALQPISFDWGSVFDPSEPIKYEVQISRDIHFISTVVIRKDLTVSQLRLPDGEELLPNRHWKYYYWRVRAIDSAGNVGEWSETGIFHVPPRQPLPDWAKFTLIGLQVTLAVAYGIVLGRILNPRHPKTVV